MRLRVAADLKTLFCSFLLLPTRIPDNPSDLQVSVILGSLATTLKQAVWAMLCLRIADAVETNTLPGACLFIASASSLYSCIQRPCSFWIYNNSLRVHKRVVLPKESPSCGLRHTLYITRVHAHTAYTPSTEPPYGYNRLHQSCLPQIGHLPWIWHTWLPCKEARQPWVT